MMSLSTVPDPFTGNSTEQIQMVPPAFPDVYPAKTTLVLVTYLLLSAFGIPGNVVTMFVLSSSEKLRRKPINVLLVHQAFIDLMVCIVTIVEETLDTREEVSTWPFVCHFFLSKICSGGCMVTSAYNMTFLSLERRSAIVNPLNYDPESVLNPLACRHPAWDV